LADSIVIEIEAGDGSDEISGKCLQFKHAKSRFLQKGNGFF